MAGLLDHAETDEWPQNLCPFRPCRFGDRAHACVSSLHTHPFPAQHVSRSILGTAFYPPTPSLGLGGDALQNLSPGLPRTTSWDHPPYVHLPAAELRQRLGCVGFIEGMLFRKEPLGKEGKKLGEAVEPGDDLSDAPVLPHHTETLGHQPPPALSCLEVKSFRTATSAFSIMSSLHFLVK